MKFRLTTQNYIFDRLLEAGTVIEPTGFRLPENPEEKLRFPDMVMPLILWAFDPRDKPLIWSLPPGAGMVPIDAEAEKIFRAKFPGQIIDPVEQLSLRGEPGIQPKKVA